MGGKSASNFLRKVRMEEQIFRSLNSGSVSFDAMGGKSASNFLRKVRMEESNNEIVSTTDGASRKPELVIVTTEQQLITSSVARPDGQTNTPREPSMPISTVSPGTIFSQRPTSTPTMVFVSTAQHATTTRATPAPEIRLTVTERETTPYDIVQVFSGGSGDPTGDDENSNIIYHGEHTSMPDEIPVPSLAPPHEPEPGLPPYYPAIPPPPPPYNNNYRPKGKGGRINSIEEERTAMIIGIVAGILIAVILVILLVLWLKSNGDRGYKTESEKAAAYGCHNPNAALLGNTSTNGSYHQQRHHQQHHQSMTNGHNAGAGGGGNGGMLSGGAGATGYGGIGSSMAVGASDGRPQMAGLVQPKPKKRDSKDVKEWYV